MCFCVCVHKYMCVPVPVCLPMCVCLWMPKIDVGHIPKIHAVLRQDLLLNLDLIDVGGNPVLPCPESLRSPFVQHWD